MNLKASGVVSPKRFLKKCVTLTKWLRRGWFHGLHSLLEPMNFDEAGSAWNKTFNMTHRCFSENESFLQWCMCCCAHFNSLPDDVSCFSSERYWTLLVIEYVEIKKYNLKANNDVWINQGSAHGGW